MGKLIRDIYTSDSIIKDNKGTSWYAVVKVKKKVINIDVSSIKCGSVEIPVDLLSFIPVRQCRRSTFFQLVFTLNKTSESEISNQNIRLSQLRKHAKHVTEELFHTQESPSVVKGAGTYFHKLPTWAQKYFTLLPTEKQMEEFHLKQGENIIELCIRIEKYATQTFSLHVWKVSDEVKFIISDVDGTITRWEMGDLIGWDSVHEGVIEMYKKITGDNKQFIYVTSRPFKKTLITRKLICDNDLPKGPILTIPYTFGGIIKAYMRNKIKGLKMLHLEQIMNIYDVPISNRCHLKNPFIAAIGNKKTDYLTYRSVCVDEDMIVMILHFGNAMMSGHQLKLTEVPLALDHKVPISSQKPTSNIVKIFWSWKKDVCS